MSEQTRSFPEVPASLLGTPADSHVFAPEPTEEKKEDPTLVLQEKYSEEQPTDDIEFQAINDGQGLDITKNPHKKSATEAELPNEPLVEEPVLEEAEPLSLLVRSTRIISSMFLDLAALTTISSFTVYVMLVFASSPSFTQPEWLSLRQIITLLNTPSIVFPFIGLTLSLAFVYYVMLFRFAGASVGWILLHGRPKSKS